MATCSSTPTTGTGGRRTWSCWMRKMWSGACLFGKAGAGGNDGCNDKALTHLPPPVYMCTQYRPPLAVVRLPVRVPYSYHGAWTPRTFGIEKGKSS